MLNQKFKRSQEKKKSYQKNLELFSENKEKQFKK